MDLRFIQRVLGAGITLAFLGGCGGVPQTTANMAHPVTAQADGRSWTLPDAKGGDLLYVSSPTSNVVYVYKYPGGALVSTLTGFDNPQGLCSDAKGDVWITNADPNGNTDLIEYAHGGTSPIATLDDSGFEPGGCAVDPITGDLAVGNAIDDVAVWRNARGKPKYYLTSCCVLSPSTITYDGTSDAIFGGFAPLKNQTGWLPSGQSKVKKFQLRPQLPKGAAFEWDGQYLGALTFSKKLGKEVVIRYKVSGGMANEAGTVPLDGVSGITAGSRFWIQGSGMVLTNSQNGDVYFFDYPKGGKPTKRISGLDDPFGITISVAPSP